MSENEPLKTPIGDESTPEPDSPSGSELTADGNGDSVVQRDVPAPSSAPRDPDAERVSFDEPASGVVDIEAVSRTGDEFFDASGPEVVGEGQGESGEAWDQELSAQRIAGELRRIESEVRGILDVVDNKRKRKLAGTRRWTELEDDIIQWKFGGRMEEQALRNLHLLVMRRHFLFNRLRFLAGTRPTWNS